MNRLVAVLVGLLAASLIPAQEKSNKAEPQPAAAAGKRSRLPDIPPLKLVPAHRLGPGPKKENSGIVKSRQWPNLYWMHNDSGDEPRVYPVRRDGTVYGSARYSSGKKTGVIIGGAINVDWEDIAVDAAGHLLVADFGNNRNDRRDLVLYYIDEPSPRAGRTVVKKKIFFRYPDQKTWPAAKTDFNYDAEALFTVGNVPYVLSKNRSDTKTKLYRLANAKPFVTNVLQPVGSFDVGGKATGADASPDGRRLVIVTYRAIWMFERRGPGGFFASSGLNRLYENDGHGVFRDASNKLPADRDSSLAVAAADIDGDGDKDLVFGNIFQQNRLYLNNKGSFTDATGRLPRRSRGTQAVLFFDANGDGHMDLLVGDQNAANSLFLNNGKGVFTDVTANNMPRDSDNTHDLAAVDVDGDKDLDLIISNDRNGNHLLLNNGKGVFSRASNTLFPSFGDASFAVAVGDVNRDGRPDVFFANGLGKNRLYLNQGRGRFVDSPNNLPRSNNNASFAIALEDVDGDGAPDAVLGTSFGQNELWLNNGKGVFVDATSRIPKASNATLAVAVADLDQDGDRDVVFGNSGAPLLLPNRLRHLSYSGALKLGGQVRITASRQAGFLSATSLAVAYASVGARASAVRLPGLGNLLINLSTLAQVIPFPKLLSPVGNASITVAVPNNRSLLNQRISVQSVVAREKLPGRPRLTNAISGQVTQ